MPVASFPPLHYADEQGLLAVGGDLHPESLLLAYRQGIFPWPISEEYPLAWFSPDPRGILETKDLHVPRRLKRYFSKLDLKITMNQAFEEVIKACASVKRHNQMSTWITPEIIEGYCELHKLKQAYSLEAWEDDQLVAGVYGTCIDGVVSGESMFTTIDHASKFCLVYLMNYLDQRGVTWIDTQMVSPVVAQLGGKEVSREYFIEKLKISSASTAMVLW